ncbi:MAG: hypothetical protein WCX46_04570 [Candidatus Paceibacterota bacterium]
METKKDATLSEKVANFKLIARESLRMELINPRLSKISAYEKEIEGIKNCIKEQEHDKLVCEYELSKLDKEHPDFEDYKKDKEECLKMINDNIKEHNDAIPEIEENIKHQKEAIDKIEKGETLVSADKLANLVDEMIKQNAINQVK